MHRFRRAMNSLWSGRDELSRQENIDNVRTGLKHAVMAGAVLLSAFYLLDLVHPMSHTGTHRDFLLIRLVAVSGLIALGLIGRRTRSTKLLFAITVSCFALAGTSISIMCLYLGGHASTYYAGIIMVLLAVVIIPWRGVHTFTTCAIVVAIWAGIQLLFDPLPLSEWQWALFANNLVFLLGTSTIAVVVSTAAFSLRRRIHRARQEQLRANDELRILNDHLAQQSRELEEARGKLQENYANLQVSYDHKSRFLDMMSHELRTPLTCILTPLEGLLQSNAKGVLREMLGDMHQAAQQLHEQIRALLDLSRYERSERPLLLADIDMGQLVDEHVRSWQWVAQDRGVTLEYDPPEEAVAAHVDRVEIAKVVRNLLSNALKFTPPGGTVRARLERTESGVLFEVVDNGIGIPKDRQVDIFRPFVQVESGDTRSSEGTGIGLALVQSIVLRHDGKIDLDSQVDRGSAFRVTLPAGDPTALQGQRNEEEGHVIPPPKAVLLPDDSLDVEFDDVAPETYEESETPLRGWEHGHVGRHSILIVEDNPHLVALLRRQFERRFEVFAARDGREGYELARTLLPDVIISDVMMPRMSGFELVETLRADPRVKNTPVLLLTARDSVPDRIQGLGLGADDYITKPFHQSELWARVVKLLQRRSVEQTLTRLNEEMSKRATRLEWRIRNMYLSMVRILVAAVDAKDYYTGGHSERVAFFSVYLGRQLGLSDPELQTLEVGGLLHDIGKIGIPDRILNKPGTLTAEEIRCIRQHATLSGQIIAKAPALGELRQIAEQHHERWDGSGYPLGLKGDEICFSARIVGVADTWDAMLSDRIYRSGMDPDAAVQRMQQLAGKDFDPRIIEVLVAHYRSLSPPSNLRPVVGDRPSGRADARPQVYSLLDDRSSDIIRDGPGADIIPLMPELERLGSNRKPDRKTE